jgi:hypothetical protein
VLVFLTAPPLAAASQRLHMRLHMRLHTTMLPLKLHTLCCENTPFLEQVVKMVT